MGINVLCKLLKITLCVHVLCESVCVCVTCCMRLTGHYPVSQRTQQAIIPGSLDTKFLISLESGCPVSLLTYYRCTLKTQLPIKNSGIHKPWLWLCFCSARQQGSASVLALAEMLSHVPIWLAFFLFPSIITIQYTYIYISVLHHSQLKTEYKKKTAKRLYGSFYLLSKYVYMIYKNVTYKHIIIIIDI